MDALTFISRMTADLAWPLTLVGVAIIFRVQLGEAIGRMKRFTAKAAGQQFAVEMEKLLEKTPPPSPENPPGREYPIARPTPAVGPIEQVILDGPEKLRVVKESPAGGTPIEVWWDTLNRELKRKGKSANAAQTRNLTLLASYLVDQKLLTPNFVPLYALLGQLHRDARKHPESVDTDAFRKTYGLLMDHLRQIGG